MPKAPDGDALPSSRYRLQKRLGAGSSGVVWEALDTERDTVVAIKRLHQLDPESLAHLKVEFRALAGIAHPNLVSLYELVGDGGDWFLVMERVEGVPLVEGLRMGSERHPAAASSSTSLHTLAEWALDAEEPEEPEPSESEVPVGPPPDAAALRDAFRQLATAVATLHAARRLHRDLKPANALITPEGRVVVLDFGLVVDMDHHSGRRSIVGTAAYMAPEQASGQPVGEAADWYAVGSMLFEALTGRRPFTGSSARMLTAKVQEEAPHPSELVATLPADLADLCAAMLSRNPANRPSAEEILQRLGAQGPEATVESAWVGRDAQLQRLREAWQASRERSVAIAIRGRSGVGKTALAERFLGELDATVLRGRCHEHESLPYKALDDLVDDVARQIRSLGLEVPPETAALAQMFPTLKRVPAVAELVDPPPLDPQELRRQGAAALRTLIAALVPVVLFVDDVQWADQESAPLLRRSVGDLSGVLVVVTVRPEGSQLLEPGTPVVDVEELAQADTEQLVRALLKGSDPEVVATVARECGGVPLFAQELARRARTGGATALQLDDALRDRVSTLPDDARTVVETTALAGRPLPTAVLDRVLERDSRSAVGLAVASRLLRETSGRVQPWHDRVREAVVEGLDPDTLPLRHRMLARAIQKVDGEPEALTVHWAAAGEPERAATFAEAAAQRAEEALAFDHAAQLYQRAIELGGPRLDWFERLGDTLANAGHAQRASEAYLQAEALQDDPLLQVELRRRAAYQLLAVGHVERGLEVLDSALQRMGLSRWPHPACTLASVVWRRARIELRGYGWTPRTTPLPVEDAVRADLAFNTAQGLGLIDYLAVSDYQARALLLALPTGDPFRVLRVLAFESAHIATPGGARNREKAAALRDEVRRLMPDDAPPELRGYAELGAAMATTLGGDMAPGAAQLEAAIRFLQRDCVGVQWEIASGWILLLWCWLVLGEYGRVAEELPGLLEAAEARGDLYLAVTLRSDTGFVPYLLRDDLPAALDMLETVMERWSPGGYTVQHHNLSCSQVRTALYGDDPVAAHAAGEAHWNRIRWSLLGTTQNLKVESLHLRGRAAAAAASTGDATALALLPRLADQIAREDLQVAPAMAAQLRGIALHLQGRTEDALSALREAQTVFEQTGIHGARRACQWLAGAAAGGDAGAEDVAAARDWFERQGAVRPEKMARYCLGITP